MSIQAVIFDRDNTLTYLDQSVLAAKLTQYLKIAPQLSPDAFVHHYVKWSGPWPRSEQEEPHFWQLFWESFGVRHQLPPETTAVFHAHTCPYSEFVAFPDVMDCLSTLRSHKLRLGVLTNNELPSVGLSLRRAGIDPDWFEVLLSNGMLGVYKPASQAYLAAAAALGLPAAQCLFVDDILDNVEGARKVGMRGVWLDRQLIGGAETIARIPDLKGLLPLLADSGWLSPAMALGVRTHAKRR